MIYSHVEGIGNNMKLSKKEKTILAIIISIFLAITIFFFNNDFIYKKTIMKITDIELVKEEIVENSMGIHEKIYTKKITGIITNGKRKGKKTTIEYAEFYSNVVTENYKIGDKVFIESSRISGLKRDSHIIIFIEIFIVLLYLLGRKRGLLTLLTIIINSGIFYAGINLYLKGINLLFLCFIISIISTIISLSIVNGINKKTLSEVISIIISILILSLIVITTCKITNYSGINFTELNFLTVPYEDIFMAGILIGGLGAIMDVSMTIVSSISELIEKNPKITKKALRKSGKAISKDIMGTMINVLFFTYLCSNLDIFVLATRNGFSVINYITSNLTIEETRFFVGAIGIVLTIPVSLNVTIKMFKKEGDKV